MPELRPVHDEKCRIGALLGDYVCKYCGCNIFVCVQRSKMSQLVCDNGCHMSAVAPRLHMLIQYFFGRITAADPQITVECKALVQWTELCQHAGTDVKAYTVNLEVTV